MSELPKAYSPQDNEKRIYELWLKSGAFAPDNADKSPTCHLSPVTCHSQSQNAHRFVIDMPLPNVTGSLHIGHALAMTLQDILTRYHRLKGDETLYLPGTDHAGIATQAVVEKKLAKEGKRRRDLGRAAFEKEVWQWKEEYHDRIVSQLKSIGVSCDWSREAFTLSDSYSEAVNTAFKHLYDKGLIYQDFYIVNWCPKCGTAISDDEVEHKPQKTTLYFFKYDKNFPITIATTRPETKFGDTAVAVNPSDDRYSQYVGKEYKVDLDGVKRTIKIIADKSVDKEFGTGAVGVTPAHSVADWLLKDKYHLDMVIVVDKYGKMIDVGPKYSGLKTLEAREKLVQYLKSAGLMQNEKEFENNLSVCYRCGGAIEPLPSLQWFVKMKPLAEKAMAAVKSGEIKIIPKRFEKIYFHWMENIRDWCISRQLWWGHRIPVWYKQDAKLKVQGQKLKEFENSLEIRNSKLEIDGGDNNKEEIYVGIKPPEDTNGWKQESDVLDTWFSSALFPFATLGYPDTNTDDYKRYYPTSVLATGYDIIFFWVARMIMMGLELTGKVPFHTVYLNGLVRDEQGRKMSKSLGNVVEPIELSDTWGTDALRMALVIGTTAGNDVNFSPSRAKGYRNFANKIWNASRFVITNLHPNTPENVPKVTPERLTEQDKKDLAQLDKITSEVTDHIEHYRFSRACEVLYEYFWHTFADVIIERSKDRIKNGGEDAQAARFVLWQILRTMLVMLHPYMPFVTETIWQEIPLDLRADKLLITAKWPRAEGAQVESKKYKEIPMSLREAKQS